MNQEQTSTTHTGHGLTPTEAKALVSMTTAVVVTFLVLLAIGYYNDYASCKRNNSIRAELRSVANDEYAAAQIVLERYQVDPPEIKPVDLKVFNARMATAKALNVSNLDCGFIPATSN